MTAAGLRLAVGLLTVLPVPAPGGRVDRATAAAAMLAAPLVGLLLGGLVLLAGATARWAGLPPLLVGVAAVAALALLTRGLHLDGLADTADGLGSGRPPAEALAVMRRSDIGPFGVIALVLVLLAQVTAVAGLLERGYGVAAALAVPVGRLVLPWACHRGVPAARPDGLGALVAGSVPPVAARAVTVAGVAVVTTAAAAADLAVAAAVATAVGLAAAAALVARCRRRLGGVTGDVLGAAVETAQTGYLLALLALAPTP